jgi:hypothetical protein
VLCNRSRLHRRYGQALALGIYRSGKGAAWAIALCAAPVAAVAQGRGSRNFPQNLRGVVRAVTRENERDGSARSIRMWAEAVQMNAEVRAGHLA